MTFRKIFIYLNLLGLLLMFSCQEHRQPKPEPRPEKSKNTNQAVQQELKLKISRFEKDLFSANIENIEKEVPKLYAKYGELFDLYNHKVINLGSYKNPKYPALLKQFITDYYMNLNYKKVIQVFPDVNQLEAGFSNGFSNFNKYFPNKKIPHLYTCISGWNQSVFTSDTILCVALDKYLGRNCDFYEKLNLDQYLRYSMQKEYILPDAFRTWAYTEFEFNDSLHNNVLDNILYEGKVIYFVKQMLPETEDSIILGYSKNQMKWCANNSKGMWSYLAEHKLLFSTDYLTIHKLVYPGPFTKFFTRESPGRAAVWLGYQIILAYMDNNENVSMQQLMDDNNYQKILKMSKFKP
jgi:hypothetical protein